MRSLSRKDMTRRAFIGQCGQVIALPFMASLLPRNLWAASASSTTLAPTRYLMFYVPCGMMMNTWTPTGTGATYTASSTLAALKDWRSKMTVISGLSNLVPGSPKGPGDHARGTGSFATASLIAAPGKGKLNGISADQVIAKTNGGSSLQLGIQDGSAIGDSGYDTSYNGSISWQDTKTPLAPNKSPLAIFQKMFPGASSSSNSKATGTSTTVPSLGMQKSVLDSVVTQTTSLQSVLGAADRALLDQYLTSIREVETSLTQTASNVAACKSPSGNYAQAAANDFQTAYAQFTTLMTLAFQCDRTRVISFMWGNGESGRIYKNLGLGTGHHALSHYRANAGGLGVPGTMAALSKINYYEMQSFASLLAAFDAVKEGNGTMLDNSVIVMSSEMSDSQSHLHTNMPVLLAGGGGGRIKSNGTHILDTNGSDYAQFLLTSIRATGTSVASFGQSQQTASYPGILG